MDDTTRQIVEALKRAENRIEELEERLRRIEESKDYRSISYIHSVLKRFVNINNIRALLHTEVLRSAGLLDGGNLAAAEAKAQELYVNDPGYGVKPEDAIFHLQSVKSEFSGEYKTADDFNPIYDEKDPT